jgi:hypothetical protein
MKLRTSPILVAAVLAHYDEHGLSATSRDCKIHKRTLWRWVSARNENPAWLDEQAELWATRDHAGSRQHAARLADYRKRRYLTGRQTIPVTGTLRRVRALHALGWTTADIAAHCGWATGDAVSEIRQRKRVTRATAAAVEATYAALSMKLGPSDKTRRHAARQGWAPPLAWDCIDTDQHPMGMKPTRPARDTIDDTLVTLVLAGEKPPRTATQAERREIVRRWPATGRPINDLARLTGWKPERYAEAVA